MIDPWRTRVVLDGGLATSLQPLGLPLSTPVDDWLRDRPEDVRAVHRQFVEAGAEIVLAGTFRLLPHLRSDWADLADRAVQIARCGAEVWASIGPASTVRYRWAPAEDGGWAALARRCEVSGVQGFALETFVDAAEAVAAVSAIRAVSALPLVACLCPRDDGRLFDGSHPGEAAAALRRAGATFVGFNCGTGPGSVERALDLVPDAEWAKPNRGELPRDQVVAALRRLAGRARFVGGCCGVSPVGIAALAKDDRPGSS